MVRPQTELSPWGFFRRDLARSIATCQAGGRFVALNVLLYGLYGFYRIGNSALIFIAFAGSLFLVGFSGTQRVWFAAQMRGKRFELSEIGKLTRAFFGRFFLLGMIFYFPGTLIFIVWAATTVNFAPHQAQPTPPLPASLVVASILLFVLVDVLLTFVAPCLTLTTSSVRTAISVGLRMIRELWPQSAWYVFAPGLTLVVLPALLGRAIKASWVLVPLELVGGMIGFVLKGATVPFYLSHQPLAGDDGSAFGETVPN